MEKLGILHLELSDRPYRRRMSYSVFFTANMEKINTGEKRSQERERDGSELLKIISESTSQIA